MISIEHLQFNYGRKVVYQDYALQLKNAGIVGLFGRNGSGKSTLLKILSGLLLPQAGQISVLGFEPAQRAPQFLEQVFIIPEEFHLPNISLTTLQKTQAAFYPHFSDSDFQRYIQALELDANIAFGSMSLGQKKKAIIAFALATHTPILLMDEPTNGLDILGRQQFKNIMQGAEQQNRLVIINTHQAHDLESLMNHVLFVDNGKIALSASMATLQNTLSLGISEQQAATDDVIYQEPIGTQWAFIAPKNSEATSHINLELLYKALSYNQQGILDAVAKSAQNQGATA